MTAILTCTTSEFVVLASDRAVSYRSSGQDAAPSSDRIGKTVLLHGQFLLGVTGFAELDRAPITDWILERLEGVSPEIWPETLADQAARSVGRIHRSLKDKHHMFIAIGFAPHARDPSTDTWHALRITISNALDDEGNSLDRATREFKVRSEKHPEDKWADIHAYPRHLPAETVKAAERTLRRFQKKRASAPQGSVELLARLVSGVSLRNPTVSGACLVSVLPKIALREGNIDVPVGTAAHISDDAITCINYIGTENQRIACMPPAIFPNGAIAKDGYVAPVGIRPQASFLNRPQTAARQ